MTSQSTISPADKVSTASSRRSGGSRASSALITVVLLVFSLLPYLSVPVAHVLSAPGTASGFFHYELPYYVANGRSAFEHGNGVFYPNPFDPRPDTPVIYAHWLPWVLGLTTAVFGFDPGNVILWTTLLAAVLFAWTTRLLVLQRTKDFSPESSGQGKRGNGTLWFFAAMWGGGLLVMTGTIVGLITGPPTTLPTAANAFHFWTDAPLQFDPFRGFWFLNWGRNALFPTEAIYHSLVAACWVCEMSRRHRAANCLFMLLAATHPWSGLELLLTINLYRAVSLAQIQMQRSTDLRRDAVWHLATSGVTLMAFLTYYKVWLPLFPHHAELESVWELDWSITATSAVLAYGLVLVPCIVRALRLLQRTTGTSYATSDTFLLCALTVAVGLVFHDRLIKPVQPLHFTRGYIWMPLFLLGLPTLQEWWNQRRLLGPTALLLPTVLALFGACDNFSFSAIHSRRQYLQQDGFHLDKDERALLSSLASAFPNSSPVTLTDSQKLNYLLPAYTKLRPWIGHKFNTPGFTERQKQWSQCFPEDRPDPDAIPEDVELILFQSTSDPSAFIASDHWTPLPLTNTHWQAWQRVR